MVKSKKCLIWVIIFIGITLIIFISFTFMHRRNRPQYLLNNSVSLHDSIAHLRVLQGQGFGRDVTNELDIDELIYLLAKTQMWREHGSWLGTQEAEWVIELSQTSNRFHRAITVALGETHGMMTERGFRLYFFRLSNGIEIIEVLERMVFD